MEEQPVQSENQPVSGNVQAHNSHRKFIVAAAVGFLVLAVIGIAIYLSIFAFFNDTSSKSKQPTTNVSVTPYSIDDKIIYTIPAGWASKDLNIKDSSNGATIGLGKEFNSSEAGSQSASLPGVVITIKRYPQSATNVSSMEYLIGQERSLSPDARDLKIITFDGRNGISYWSDPSKFGQAYRIFEDSTHEHLWYIDILYLSRDKNMQAENKYQLQTEQFINSIHFK